MPFNANTYRANKYRREALAQLAEARAIKARVKGGTAYAWEPPRVAHFVRIARLSWRMYLSLRRIARPPLPPRR